MANEHEIKSEKILVKEIFSTTWFRIPEYQRPYIWSSDQIDDLLDDQISAAFEMLLEEIEANINTLNATGAQAFEKGRHEDIARILAKATKRTELRTQVFKLAQEWRQDVADNSPAIREARPLPRPERRRLGRIRKGARTPEKTFYLPILEELVALGGSAKMARVIDGVGKRVEGILKPVDLQSVPSDSTIIRWRNTVQWARSYLKDRGLLKGDSPHGIWEISAEGRAWLSEQQSKLSKN